MVKKLYVEYGDKVKKGQLLAQLDKAEIQAGVDQSRASLEAARGQPDQCQSRLRTRKVDAEGPDVPLLKRAYERAQGMAKDGVVSASALEDAQKAYELALNKQNVSKAQVTVLKAKIAQAEATRRARPGEPEAIRRAARIYRHSVSNRRHRSFSRRRNRRRGELDSRSRFFRHAGDDARRYQPGLRKGQS